MIELLRYLCWEEKLHEYCNKLAQSYTGRVPIYLVILALGEGLEATAEILAKKASGSGMGLYFQGQRLHLTLNDKWVADFEALQELLAYLKDMQIPLALHLSCLSMRSDRAVFLVLQQLADMGLDNLQELDLGGQEIGRSSNVLEILEQIARFKQLINLDISGNKLALDPDSAIAACKSLKALKKLTSLNIRENGFGESAVAGAALKQLTKSLKKLTNLRT